jgi:beta-glucosidase
MGGRTIIDNWGPQTPAGGRRRSAKTAQIHLTGGQKVPICVEYLEIDEDASVDLKWRLVESSTDNSFFARMTDTAAAADAVIVVLGETNQEVGEGKDRQNLNFNPGDIQMLRAARRSGKPVVAVMLNGRPLVATPVVENADAILEAWFPGESGGSAVVDVLFGDYNPSGKLSVSIPREQGPVPIYYSRKPTSRRRYSDGDGTPLYAFGHGLSYSTFEYANMTVTPANPTIKDVITVSVDVTNTSGVDGTEVVQLYVRDKIGSVTTPVMALKGFSFVPLKAGETKTVTMEIMPRKHLWLIDLDMKRTVEPGEFDFMVGASSADIKFTETVNLAE